VAVAADDDVGDLDLHVHDVLAAQVAAKVNRHRVEELAAGAIGGQLGSGRVPRLGHDDVAQRRLAVLAGDARGIGGNRSVDGKGDRVDLDPLLVVLVVDFAIDARKLNVSSHENLSSGKLLDNRCRSKTFAPFAPLGFGFAPQKNQLSIQTDPPGFQDY